MAQKYCDMSIWGALWPCENGIFIFLDYIHEYIISGGLRMASLKKKLHSAQALSGLGGNNQDIMSVSDMFGFI